MQPAQMGRSFRTLSVDVALRKGKLLLCHASDFDWPNKKHIYTTETERQGEE